MLTLDEWEIVHQKLIDWVEPDMHYPIFLCLETSKVLSEREEYKELMSTYESRRILEPILTANGILTDGSWYPKENSFWEITVELEPHERIFLMNHARLTFWEKHKNTLIGVE